MRLHCPACGYDLQGAPTSQCPECGKFADPLQLKERVASMRLSASEVGLRIVGPSAASLALGFSPVLLRLVTDSAQTVILSSFILAVLISFALLLIAIVNTANIMERYFYIRAVRRGLPTKSRAVFAFGCILFLLQMGLGWLAVALPFVVLNAPHFSIS